MAPHMAHKPESQKTVLISFLVFVTLCVLMYIPWSILAGLGN
jgi:hypothetical protein